MEDYIKIYAIMPSSIYKTKLLTPTEKLLAERITALCKNKGYAWITNKSLAICMELEKILYQRVLKS